MRAMRWLVLATCIGLGCSREPAEPRAAKADAPAASTGADTSHDAYADEREELARSIARDGIHDDRVLDAIRTVPRHELVPDDLRSMAYWDQPLPIGHEQTISQPYIVALMTQLADVDPGDKVLEVGTGSGYQAAVLRTMGADVYTIEIVERLGERASEDLERLGYDVHARIGDGYRGWPEEAPFDAIVITAAPPEVPRPLLEQLRVGGRLVVPVGERAEQELVVITRTDDGYDRSRGIPVLFVPMTGEARGR
ncbi:protein-L-isoaspartate(D-aspartate) O-methyltransferase [Sandaracinus amylolyticus]|uniref:Protein-L-isoaspartate O-methyltransferase n=1 Tax=Sandaracinus amylolyticus TaxID=927083 RepID=A0A0F6SDX9_9BACT|nr:protein-L-isoaspartate(D-aspartate) O-methyltransferase [Sandaracinus amylolyticus]AKF04224.1 Putative L-isoaspartate O-methyltransferase [Sandaracinus amylolyticus]